MATAKTIVRARTDGSRRQNDSLAGKASLEEKEKLAKVLLSLLAENALLWLSMLPPFSNNVMITAVVLSGRSL